MRLKTIFEHTEKSVLNVDSDLIEFYQGYVRTCHLSLLSNISEYHMS